MLRGPATLTTGAIAALHNHDCGLFLLSGRRTEPTGMLLGRPSHDASVRLGQMRLALDSAARSKIAREILRRKLGGQLRFLRQAQTARTDRRYRLRCAITTIAEALTRLRTADTWTVVQLCGLEGAAAAAYFDAYAALLPPSLGFTGRNRRPPRDPANAVLSLAYTLGTAEAAREAWIAGFDPSIGFLHAPSPGRESLACDLMEPLRPVLDAMIWRLFASEKLRPEHFSRDADACLLGKAGRMTFYAAWEGMVAPARRALRLGLRPFARACRTAVKDTFDNVADAAS